MPVAPISAGSDTEPITVALRQRVRRFCNTTDVPVPGALLSEVIPLVVFFAFQRQFVS